MRVSMAWLLLLGFMGCADRSAIRDMLSDGVSPFELERCELVYRPSCSRGFPADKLLRVKLVNGTIRFIYGQDTTDTFRYSFELDGTVFVNGGGYISFSDTVDKIYRAYDDPALQTHSLIMDRKDSTMVYQDTILRVIIVDMRHGVFRDYRRHEIWHKTLGIIAMHIYSGVEGDRCTYELEKIIF